MSGILDYISGVLVPLVLISAMFGPWIVHIVWCIDMATQTGSAIALLLVGIVIPPVGWVHGASILLGFGGWI